MTTFRGLNANGKPDMRPVPNVEVRTGGAQHGGEGDDEPRREILKSPANKVKSGRVEKKKKEIEVKTVIFVPHTAHSKLAKMLREEEISLEKHTGYRVKYVERAGTNIGNILCKSDHWSGRQCGRNDCLLCLTKAKTGKNTSQSCTKRNIVYETWCQLCLEREESRAEEGGKDKS